MDSNILDTILNGGTPKPVAAVDTRPMSPESVAKVVAVLAPYALDSALDAIATKHHLAALKQLQRIGMVVQEAMNPDARRSELTAAFEMIDQALVVAKREHAQSLTFERAAYHVMKNTPTQKLLDGVVDANNAALLCDVCGVNVADVDPESGNERVCYDCKGKTK